MLTPMASQEGVYLSTLRVMSMEWWNLEKEGSAITVVS